MSEHSEVGASGMHRWAACPGSVRLSKGIDNRSSFYAAEGTLAHEVAAWCLNTGLPPEEHNNFKFQIPVKIEGYDLYVTQEMIDAVRVYVDYVWGMVAEAEQYQVPYELFVEHRMHMDSIDDDAYGTVDCGIYYPDTAHLIVLDYKHGSGVGVEAEDNPQFLYYALALAMDRGVKEIDVGVVQPRFNHEDGPVRLHRVTGVELLEWATVLEDAIQATRDPEAPFATGAHCRWCNAAPICQTLRDEVLESAMKDFKKDDGSYDPKELAELLEKIPRIKAWCNKVDEFAYQEAMHGRVPPGMKLVDKRAQRQWIDENTVKDFLAMTFDMSDKEMMTDPKLKSPAQIEKILGKADSKQIISLYKSESNGYALVGEDDKRPAANLGPENDFEAIANV